MSAEVEWLCKRLDEAVSRESPGWKALTSGEGSWRRAVLLKDRTRREIRARARAGEPHDAIAQDYDVPVPFVEAVAAWQLFKADSPSPHGDQEAV